MLEPGGPGASGVEFVRDSAKGFPAAIRDRFDVVGSDPRGVGTQQRRALHRQPLDGRAALIHRPSRPHRACVLVDDARAYAEARGSRRNAPRSGPRRRALPIVVVGSTFDPATLYAWAVALAAQLESGTLSPAAATVTRATRPSHRVQEGSTPTCRSCVFPTGI
ncbi:MAG: alpha/beta hydrolase [Candidatus Limnocylindrales bacterium]